MTTVAPYPPIFSGLTLDEVNYKLALGLATEADARAYVEWWNTSGKRVTVATLRHHSTTLGQCECTAPYISISDP